MNFPFVIIESKNTFRNQFELLDGCQPTHALFYLKKGSFSVEIDGVHEEINAGDCVILPDYIHFKRSVVNPIEFIYIKFATNYSCPYSFDIPYGKVAFKDKQRFESNILALSEIITNDDYLSAGYREHLVRDVLFQICFENQDNVVNKEEKQSSDRIVNAAVTYIDKNLCDKILIHDICHAVCTNVTTLNFKFRREFGMSVGNFILNRRMKKAIHLLLGTTYSIGEIAFRCGFDNVYYFSNVFKKINKVSPMKFRNKRGI